MIGRRRTHASGPVLMAAEGTPAEKMAAFVERGRALVQRSGLSFEAQVWDVTGLRGTTYGKPAERYKKRLFFSRGKTPLGVLVEDVAKAYIAPLLGCRSHTCFRSHLRTFHFIGRALAEKKKTSMAELTPAMLDNALEMAGGAYGESCVLTCAMQMQAIAIFLGQHGMVHAALSLWRHGLQSPRPLAGTAGPEFDERAADRLPSKAFLQGIAYCFANATRLPDVVVSGACVLMLPAPVRPSEVMSFQEDCLVTSPDGRGAWLRWPGGKGEAPGVKPVPSCMLGLVEEAIRRLLHVTAEARAIKRAYDRDSSRMYLPPDLEHLRGKAWLTIHEVSLLLGTGVRSTRAYVRQKKLARKRPADHEGEMLVSFKALERHVLKIVKHEMWLAGGPDYHPLFLVQRSAFRCARGTANKGSTCMFQVVTASLLSQGLNNAACPSMLQRMGYDPEGKLEGRPGSFRHLLLNKATLGGASQEDRDEWALRRHPRSSTAYDHVPNSEIRKPLDAVHDALLGLGMPGAASPRPGRRARRAA